MSPFPLLGFTLLCGFRPAFTGFRVPLKVVVHFAFQNNERESAGVIVVKIRLDVLVAVFQQRLEYAPYLFVGQMIDHGAVVKVSKKSFWFLHIVNSFNYDEIKRKVAYFYATFKKYPVFSRRREKNRDF